MKKRYIVEVEYDFVQDSPLGMLNMSIAEVGDTVLLFEKLVDQFKQDMDLDKAVLMAYMEMMDNKQLSGKALSWLATMGLVEMSKAVGGK